MASVQTLTENGVKDVVFCREMSDGGKEATMRPGVYAWEHPETKKSRDILQKESQGPEGKRSRNGDGVRENAREHDRGEVSPWCLGKRHTRTATGLVWSYNC